MQQPQIGPLSFAKGQERAAAGLDKIRSVAIVQVDHAVGEIVQHGEEDGLGLRVGLHGLMIIKMILGQVGEYSAREMTG